MLMNLMAPLKSSVVGGPAPAAGPRPLCGSHRPLRGAWRLHALQTFTLVSDSILEHESSPAVLTGKCGGRGWAQLQEVPRCRARPPGGQPGPLPACQPSAEAPTTCGAFYFPSSPFFAQANRFLPLDTFRPLCSPQLPPLPSCSALALPGPHRAFIWGRAPRLRPHIRNMPFLRTQPRSGVATVPPPPA